uniref:hypothetical protein n=1 Tax=Psychrobacter immobilis TaxID=498 RepID=UPI00191A06D0
MSPSSNDMNPDIATKLPSSSLNSNDVILNVEGRKRMRRPYERYMQQMMHQTTQKAVNDSKPQVSIYAAKINKSRSFNNTKFLSVISVFCAVFLLAVFAFDYLLAKNSNISLATDSVSASFVKDKVSANQVNAAAAPNPKSITQFIETQNEMQNTDGEIGMIKVKTMLSEDDFKRAAQNTLFRDSDSHDLESNSARFVVISQPTMDQQD